MSDVKELEARIADLESRIAFQEVTIEELNGVVTKQQDQLDDLVKKVRELLDQVKPTVVSKEAETETPPHY